MLWNVGFLPRLFHDGRAATLEDQAAGPLFSPGEMANTAAQLERTLNAIPAYRPLFAQAFGLRPDEPVTTALVVRALAAFEGTLVSFNSRYDQYIRGDAGALNAAELHGYELFHSFKTRCAVCHAPPLFTDGELTVIGAPEPDGVPFDRGAEAVAGDSTLRGAFRNPSLRNIELTAPYMHSGAHATLEEAVRFYSDEPGSHVPAGERVLLSWLMFSGAPVLSDAEVDALVAFLRTLTDESAQPQVPARVPSGLPVLDGEAGRG